MKRAALWLGLLCGCVSALAQPPAGAPTVSIVIDDLGNNLSDGRRILAWREPVAIAVLPHTTHGRELAERAHRSGKEVLLHLPMDADDGATTEPGPGRIEMQMSTGEIAAMLAYDLATVPHASGVNNHMGSRLTQSAESMEKLMQALTKYPQLFFLDSRTSARSVAAHIAAKSGIATLERDVFLDNERGDDAVRNSLRRLERLLAVRGHAVVIGHPYPETLAALEQWLPSATARGIRVVPFSVMLERQGAPHAERPAATRPGL